MIPCSLFQYEELNVRGSRHRVRCVRMESCPCDKYLLVPIPPPRLKERRRIRMKCLRPVSLGTEREKKREQCGRSPPDVKRSTVISRPAKKSGNKI